MTREELKKEMVRILFAGGTDAVYDETLDAIIDLVENNVDFSAFNDPLPLMPKGETRTYRLVPEEEIEALEG